MEKKACGDCAKRHSRGYGSFQLCYACVDEQLTAALAKIEEIELELYRQGIRVERLKAENKDLRRQLTKALTEKKKLKHLIEQHMRKYICTKVVRVGDTE